MKNLRKILNVIYDIPYKYIYSLGNDGVPMEIDPISCLKLRENKNKYIYQWNPKEALVS
jgi:hypothetical protein